MHYEYHQFCLQGKSIENLSDFSEKTVFLRFEYAVYSLLLFVPILSR